MPVTAITVTEPHQVLEFSCEVHPDTEKTRIEGEMIQLGIVDPSLGAITPLQFGNWGCVAEWANRMSEAVILAEANAAQNGEEFMGDTQPEILDSDTSIN